MYILGKQAQKGAKDKALERFKQDFQVERQLNTVKSSDLPVCGGATE